MSAASFITAQRTVRKLCLRGEVGPLPPGALPNLRELNAPTELVKQIVPGRPVEAIQVITSQGNDRGWFWKEVAESTAPVRRLFIDHTILNTGIVEQMAKILPSLESLRFPVFDDVSRPFAPYLDSFSFRHYSTSLKSSLHSSVSRTYAFTCLVAKTLYA